MRYGAWLAVWLGCGLACQTLPAQTNVIDDDDGDRTPTAEVTIVLPDSRVTPRITVPLQAFESRQISVIHDLGLGNVYNARISVRVSDGAGKLTAYASVVDMSTQAPTYVPAQ